LFVALSLLVFVGCDGDQPPSNPPEGEGPGGQGAAAAVDTNPATGGLDALLASMDPSADPCDDFYQYACGGWMEATERPADRPRYSRSFSTIADENERVLREILESAAADPGDDPARKKMGDFYSSCVDQGPADAAGLAPLEPLLAEVDAVENKKDLMAQIGRMHATVYGRVGWLGSPPSPVFFRVVIEADYMKDPTRNMAQFRQAGLGLPSRDMYLAEGDDAAKLMAAYEAHVAEMLQLTGVEASAAAEQATGIVALEKRLADKFLSPVELRDDEANYHKVGAKGLQKAARGLDWKSYFETSGVPQSTEIDVHTYAYFKALPKIIKQTDLATLKAYLRWHAIHAMAPYMGTSFDAKAFELQTLTLGVTEQSPRWKRCSQETMWALPDLVGKEFADRKFAGESKAIASDMIDRINAAMEASFPELAWMDDKTRGRALEKITAMDRKIGYPAEWRDYAEVTIVRDDYFANALAERGAEAKRRNAKIGAPVDRGEWHMPPPLVNAYFNPTNNEIAFPAGILQPPFFSKDQPQVMNYGGIGAVVGHELTHGFDDSGRKYDKTGKLTPWWEPEVAERFEERVACVVSQYDAYEPLPGHKVNGKLTAGENIADIGGVKEAYFAYKAWEKETGAEAPLAEGHSNDQIFFVAWAQNWCDLQLEGSLKRRLETDSHSPGRYRAVGPLADLPEFGEAFACEEGSAMRPKDACEIW
jgi:predicted metalloendopeptidase